MKSCLPSFFFCFVNFQKMSTENLRGYIKRKRTRKNCTLFCKNTFICICDKARDKSDKKEKGIKKKENKNAYG